MTVSDRINLAIAICAGLSAIVAAVYTYVTMRILKSNRDAVSAMRDQVHELSRPRIQIWPSTRIGTQIICLRVRNSGPSAAERVSLTIDRDVFSFGDEDKNLRDFSAFRQPFQAMGPGSEMLFYLGTGPDLFGEGGSNRTPTEFTMQAMYESAGRRYTEATTVDLSPFRNSAVPHDPIAEEIEKLRKEAKTIGQEIRTFRERWAAGPS